jgi:hypothetical protein
LGGMIDEPRLFSWFRPFTLALLAMGSSGCWEELGPERMPVTRVTGVVREGSHPLSGGWIEFFPVDGTVGNLRSARLRADGSFEADHVPVGLNLIRLVNVSLSSPVANQIFGVYYSPIRRTIPAQSTEPLLIDLVDEMILLQNSRARRARPDVREPGESR